MSEEKKRKRKVSRIQKPEQDSTPQVMSNPVAVKQAVTGNGGLSVEEIRARQIIFGAWTNVDQVAGDVWNSVHSTLLSGYPVFAYKSTQQGSELVQIVIVKNVDQLGRVVDYGVGEITTGFSALVPHVPINYLMDVVYEDLKKYKIDKEILHIYEQIIRNEGYRQ